jgi:hypothetical protein
MDVPVLVVTHVVPREWVHEGSPFTFVTDGVESAVGLASYPFSASAAHTAKFSARTSAL